MAYKFVNSSQVSYFNKVQAIAEKFEADLIASGRFKYLKTEGNKKIYVEMATGREVPVLVPSFPKMNNSATP
jgi:hypothetical protein